MLFFIYKFLKTELQVAADIVVDSAPLEYILSLEKLQMSFSELLKIRP
jgi:hypothetical protein